VRELKMYADFLSKSVKKLQKSDEKQRSYLAEFRKNMLDGIKYYLSLFPTISDLQEKVKAKSLEICGQIKTEVESLPL